MLSSFLGRFFVGIYASKKLSIYGASRAYQDRKINGRFFLNQVEKWALRSLSPQKA
jgi:hypothetical protein